MDERAMETIDPDQAALTARLIYFAIAVTPFLVAAMAWFYTGGGDAPMDGPAPHWFYLWGGTILGGAALWAVVRSRVLGLVERAGRPRPAEAEASVAGLLTQLILAWAGAELVGLAGAFVFLLTGHVPLLLVSLALALLLLGTSRPRREWFRRVGGEA